MPGNNPRSAVEAARPQGEVSHELGTLENTVGRLCSQSHMLLDRLESVSRCEPTKKETAAVVEPPAPSTPTTSIGTRLASCNCDLNTMTDLIVDAFNRLEL